MEKRIILNIGDGTCIYLDENGNEQEGIIVGDLYEEYGYVIARDVCYNEFKILYKDTINIYNIVNLAKRYNLLSRYEYNSSNDKYPEMFKGKIVIDVPRHDPIEIFINKNFYLKNIQPKTFNDLLLNIHSKQGSVNFDLQDQYNANKDPYIKRVIDYNNQPEYFIPKYFNFGVNKENYIKNKIYKQDLEDFIENKVKQLHIQNQLKLNMSDIINGKVILIEEENAHIPIIDNLSSDYTIILDLDKYKDNGFPETSELYIIKPVSIHKGYIGSFIGRRGIIDCYIKGCELSIIKNYYFIKNENGDVIFVNTSKYKPWRYDIEDMSRNFIFSK